MGGGIPSPIGFLGIAIIVVGIYILNCRKGHVGFLKPFKELAKNRGAVYMIIAAFLFAVTTNIDFWGITHGNVSTYMIANHGLLGLANLSLGAFFLQGRGLIFFKTGLALEGLRGLRCIHRNPDDSSHDGLSVDSECALRDKRQEGWGNGWHYSHRSFPRELWKTQGEICRGEKGRSLEKHRSLTYAFWHGVGDCLRQVDKAAVSDSCFFSIIFIFVHMFNVQK